MDHNKKLLAILGSPHNNGATATMLEFACKTAEKKGWKVDYINLYDKNLAYCNGCWACMKTKNCVQKDDIQKISDLIRACDMVVLAAPVYWANVPAPVKNLFDRLRGVAMEETSTFPKPRLSGKQRYLLLTACNTPAPFSAIFGQSTGAIRSMKEFFKTSGMRYAGKCVWTGQNKKQMPRHIMKKIESCL